MKLQRVFAVIATADLDRAERFYTALIGRPPDARPMDGLIEWHGPEQAGLQAVLDPHKAGNSMATLLVPDMKSARTSLRSAGLDLGPDIQADKTIIAQIDDPDGNRLTLAEPPKIAGN